VTDNRSSASRSALMARIGGKNTAPEMAVRRLLHSLGYRYRLHRRDLPGTPDIVFPSRRKVIFVNGCFWHSHGCRIGQPPKTRTEFWEPKLERNRLRDRENNANLRRMGWKRLTLWQCQIGISQKLAAKLFSFLGPPGKNSIDNGARSR
jgi:DNA mismatch endonuclease, patch repair protein